MLSLGITGRSESRQIHREQQLCNDEHVPHVVATIAELWRYPVKGMRGERLHSVELDAHGIVGDRRWAVESSGAPRGKPMLTGAERAAMLLYTASSAENKTCVVTPQGQKFSIHDPALLSDMQSYLPGGHTLTLRRSATPQTDVRPVALLGRGSVQQLAQELARPVDERRFRANVLLQLQTGFAEDLLTGRTLRLGLAATLRITERTPRCRVVTLDPDTAQPDPQLMKHLDRVHEGRVGIYGTVLQLGTLRVGDRVVLE